VIPWRPSRAALLAVLTLPALGACSASSRSGAASGSPAASGTGGTNGSGIAPGSGGTITGSGAAPGGGGTITGSGAAPSSGGTATKDGGLGGSPTPTTGDPGSGPWVPVPAAEVATTCKLDPAKLAEADAALNTPWAIVRYGRLCHEFKSEGMVAAEAWSTTKTLGAVTAGVVAYQTKDIPRTGPMTGPFSDDDRVDQWLSPVPYNPDAHVAHVMAMVAHNTSLALGQKPMVYDTIGTTEINSISDILNAAIRQEPGRLGADLEQFTQTFVFGPLGMHDSTWSTGAPTKVFAYSWSTTVRDMARVGLLMLHGGIWSGQRLLDAEWIYRMTHPAFEDSNTGYGYLTWLNASSNHHFGGIPGPPAGLQQVPMSPGPCAPVAVFRTHPHGLSESPDCNYAPPYSCTQQFDVGVWQAVGLGNQLIQGHPGLDILIVARDIPPFGTGPDAPRLAWDAVRPAVIAADPTYAGDETKFCAAYGSNAYAPDAH
jgi:hypothetical protein